MKAVVGSPGTWRSPARPWSWSTHSIDLAQPAGADRLAVGDQAAVGVDRQPAADLELAVGDQPLLLAVLAEAALGEVHQLGPGLGVLQLGDVDLPGPMPAASNAARAAWTVAPSVISGASHGLNTSNVPNRRVRNSSARTLDRPIAERAGPRSADISTTAAPALARAAEHVRGQRVVDHRRRRDLVDGDRPCGARRGG